MESRVQRLKFAWRVFMIANFGIGAYIFAMAKMKEGGSKSVKQVEAPPPASTGASPASTGASPSSTGASPASTSKPAVMPVDVVEEQEFVAATPIAELVKVREPISEDEQRELFQWILDEKRKVKPKNRDERKKIDEEKSILKQFIRANSIPSL